MLFSLCPFFPGPYKLQTLNLTLETLVKAHCCSVWPQGTAYDLSELANGADLPLPNWGHKPKAVKQILHSSQGFPLSLRHTPLSLRP